MKPGQIGSITYCSRRGLRRPCAGFTLLELVIVIAILSVLLTVAISRFLALQADAEKAAMDSMLGTLRSALGIKVAELIVKQELGGVGVLVGSNPVDRLAEAPGNYMGTLTDVDPSTLQSGSWYFDTRSRALVYVVRNKGHFTGGVADPPRARFAVQPAYVDRNRNGSYDPGVDAIEGLRLKALEPYAWTN